MECVMSCHTTTRPMMWCRLVGSHHHCGRVQEQSTESALHCSYLYACYVGLNGHCNTYQACASLIDHCSTDTHVRLGNMWALLYGLGQRSLPSHFAAHGALRSREAGSGAVRHVAAPEPSSAGSRGSRAVGHVATLEPSSAGSQGPGS
jgi:hypothetical protein